MSLKTNFYAAVIGASALLLMATGASATVANEKTANGATTTASVVTTATNGAQVVLTGAGATVTINPGGGGGGPGGGGGGGAIFGPPAGGDQDGSLPRFQFERDGFKTTQSGAAAGGVDGKLAVWINGGYATFDEDQTAIDSDGDTYTLAVGADWVFSSRFLAGLSVAGGTTDTTTTFNSGSIDTNTYTVTPYFVTILGKNRNLLLDGAVGYSMSDNDAERTSGTITSSYDSSNWFATANLTYLISRGKFTLRPKVGVFWMDNTTDGYTESGGTVVAESDTQLGRLSAGVRVDYAATRVLTPFVSVAGEYDFESEDYSSFTSGNRPSQEKTGATIGLGTEIRLSDRTTGNLSGTTAVGRDDYSTYTLSGSLRFNF